MHNWILHAYCETDVVLCKVLEGADAKGFAFVHYTKIGFFDILLAGKAMK